MEENATPEERQQSLERLMKACTEGDVCALLQESLPPTRTLIDVDEELEDGSDSAKIALIEWSGALLCIEV